MASRDVNAGAAECCKRRRHSGSLSAKQRAQYRFSILLIDDKPRIGLEVIYRISMHPIKENDMPRFASHAFAALVALALTLGSIDAICKAPPVQTAAHAAIAIVELA